MKSLLIILFVFIQFYLSAQRNIEGFVFNSEGKPIDGVTLIVNNQITTLSDINGYFNISHLNDSSICAKLYGYRDKCIKVDPTQKSIKIVLTENITYAQEIIVKSLVQNRIYNTQMGLIELKAENLKTLPTIAGETDLLKILQFTPGVSKSDVFIAFIL